MTLSHRTLLTFAVVPGFLAIGILTTTRTAGAQTVSPYATQISELHAAAKLLQDAKHDYKGHRAQAVHQIHLAVHILHPIHKKPKAPGIGVKPPVGNNANEPQSISDALLRQALEQLKVVRGQLANAPPQALAAVRSAISELETALAIK